MMKRRAIWAALALPLAACGGSSKPAAETAATAETSQAPTTLSGTDAASYVGRNLQAALDDAQAAGVQRVTSHDANGRGRTQILNLDWQVCNQTPATGTTSSPASLDFGVVKTNETCPTSDQSGPLSVTGESSPLPNLVGKSLKIARASLPAGSTIDERDASGRDRLIIVESNWQVCRQSPSAGTPYRGQPVSLGAVKFGESCP